MNFNLSNSGGSGTGFSFGGGEVNKSAFGAPASNDKKPFNFSSQTTTSAAPAFGSGLMFGSPTTSANASPGSLFSATNTTPGLFGAPGSNPTFTGFGSTGTGSPFGQTAQAQVTPTQQGGLNLSFGGANTTAQPTLGFGQTATTSAPSGLSFGSPAGGGGFGFQTPSTGFSAAPQQPVAPTSIAAPAFNFGGASKGLSFGSTTTAGGLSFGSTVTTTATTGLSFGATTTTAGGLAFGTSPGTGGLGTSAFGAPTTASGGLNFGASAPAPAFTSAATGLSFGATTSAPTTGLSFGSAVTQSGLSFPTTSTPTTGLSFGTAPATTGGLSFGTTPGLSFGATATTASAGISTTPASTATGLSFGTTPASTAAPPFGTSTTSSGFSFSAPATSAGGLTLAPAATTAPTGLSFNTPGTSAGLSFKTTAPTVAAATAPSTGFQLGAKTPATGLSGFSLPTTSAPASTAATTAATSGITALGQPTTTTQASLITTTTTTAVTAPQPVSSLTFAQLEDNINKWTLQLEEQEKLFINQATQINAWDRLLIENGEKIVELNEAVQTATSEQQAVEHELEFIVAQQRELEELLAPLERELAKEQRGREPEREHMYQLAETLDSQLKQMSEDLKEVIQHLNDTNRSQDGNDPIVQIGRILNAHMSSMQWVDNSIAQISTKLDQLKTTHDTLRRDNERSFHLTYN